MKYLICVLAVYSISLYAEEQVLNYGQYQFQMDYLSLSASDFFDTYKQKQALIVEGDSLDYDESGYEFNLRYGATPYTTLVVGGKWKSNSLAGLPSSSYGNSGFEAYYLGVQMRRSQGQYQTFQWNIGYWGDGSYDAEEPLTLGGGDSIWEISTSYYFSLNPYHSFFNFDLGYRFRGNGISDELFVHSGLIYQLKGFSDIQISYDALESDDISRIPFNTLTYPIERGYQKAGVSFSIGLGQKLAIIVGFEQIIRGRNIFQTGGYNVGLSYTF